MDRAASSREGGASPCVPGASLQPPVAVPAGPFGRLESPLCRAPRGVGAADTTLESASCLRRCCLPWHPPPRRRRVYSGHGGNQCLLPGNFIRVKFKAENSNYNNDSEKRASSPEGQLPPVGLLGCGSTKTEANTGTPSSTWKDGREPSAVKEQSLPVLPGDGHGGGHQLPSSPTVSRKHHPTARLAADTLGSLG